MISASLSSGTLKHKLLNLSSLSVQHNAFDGAGGEVDRRRSAHVFVPAVVVRTCLLAYNVCLLLRVKYVNPSVEGLAPLGFLAVV